MLGGCAIVRDRVFVFFKTSDTNDSILVAVVFLGIVPPTRRTGMGVLLW